MKRLALAAFLIALCAGAAAGQTPAARRDAEILAADQALTAIRRDIESGGEADVVAIENDLRALLAEARGDLAPVTTELRTAERALAQLGAAPAEGAVPESAPLAQRRAARDREVSVLQGQRTRIVANIQAAGALLGDLSRRRLSLIYASLGERGPSLASPARWGEAAAAAGEVSGKAAAFISARVAEKPISGLGGSLASLALLFASLLATLLMVGPAHRWMRRTFARRLEAFEPTRPRRVAVAGVRMLARLAPGVVGGLLIGAAAQMSGLLDAQGWPVARALWLFLLAFLMVEGFTSGLFSPRAPGWRLAEVEAARGRRVAALLLAIVGAFGLKSVFVALAEAADAAPALATLVQAAAAVATGAFLVLLTRRSLWARAPAAHAGESVTPEGPAQGEGFWPPVRIAGRAVGLAIIAAAALGYVPLADFIASRVYLLALILSVAWFLRAALTEAGVFADRRLRARGEPDAEGDGSRVWIGLGVDLVLLLALIPLALLLAGLDAASVRDAVAQAFLGFRIGGVSISIADIVAALVLFFGVLAGTRLIQRGLSRGSLAKTKMDEGVRHSLTTLLGYLGLGVALVAGVTALGFDLSNLALIAGALSVGVGFGLQSVVNNFVSGLILLFERPIKVGDWIVTASGEGVVKKISVRSTEIETFDRSTIIVPNAELISSTVTNWTHKDRLGRIIVSVGVSYESDPEAVRAVLLKCAQDHPEVVRFPEPFVVWSDFGPSALQFELRAFLADITNGLQARTDLRFAIFNALKTAGIEIPSPRQDIYVKELPAGVVKAKPAKSSRAASPAPRAPRLEPEAHGDIAPDD